MLKKEQSLLLFVDIQEKLLPVMDAKNELLLNLKRLAGGAGALQIPTIITEHCPTKLGRTVPELAEILDDTRRIEKNTFSCVLEGNFLTALEEMGRRQIVIAGIETHVCVYQTAAMLREGDYEVQVVADAVTSRTPENKSIGLERIRSSGATLTSVETVLFEWQQIADGDSFKKIIQLVK